MDQPSDDSGRRPAATTPEAGHRLELRLDAHPFWLSPLRALVTDLAGRADFDLEASADLTMMVDEACANLMTKAAESQPVTCALELWAGTVTITVTVPVTRQWTDLSDAAPSDTFSWQIMGTLADDITPLSGSGGAPYGVRMTKSRPSR